MPRLRAVEGVEYYLADGSGGTVAAGDYVVDVAGEPGRLRLVDGASWPVGELRVVNGVRVRFEAGYGGAGDVPRGVRQAVLLLVGALYENREEVVVAQGVTVMALPFGARALLGPHRVYRWL